MSIEVTDWLRGLGLERYAAAFRDNDIDATVLRRLTAEDLRELGVASVGHRRRLLDAIAAFASTPVDDAPGLPAESTAIPVLRGDAERRQLTVMFCDLVGSTALSTRLDPEDLREVIAPYQRAVSDVVCSLDGFIARYMGDGVLVYFGYPRAHEDDAERAVRTGLALAERVARLKTHARLESRIGIATGLVVVGDLIGQGQAQERGIVGETPNLAARMQELAPPGGVVIAEGTRRLLGGLFELSDLGAVVVKGFAAPVPVWQALRPSAVESRFEAFHASTLTPLVGREEGLELLVRLWQRAKAGDGQVVLVSGEPGIGKSRIAAALRERLRDEPHVQLRHFCSPYHQHSALHPFIEQLGRAAGFAHDDPPAARLEKFEILLARAAPPDEDVALLADLMSLPTSERHQLPNLSPQRKKEMTLEALIRQLDGLARRQPVLMVFEDAHWIDPTSRELLDFVVKRVRSLPVLLIVTFRPEFEPPWTDQPQVTMLALNRLDRRDRTALVMQIAGGKPLPAEVIDQIAERTDGVPLFVEELTKSVLESGQLRDAGDRYVLDGVLPPFAIPTTLHDSLLARLDRLLSVRLVAQIGAAIGREFSYELLSAVSSLTETELQTSLTRLVGSELVFQRGTPPDAVYSFKHALVQDAAHSSLLRSTRQQLHAQIAETLVTCFPETVNSQPELVAQHYTEAGSSQQATTYWVKAARQAAARSAMIEAEAHLRKGLDLVARLLEGVERQRLEIELQIALGGVTAAMKGQAAPDVGRAYARARALCEQLGDSATLVLALNGQAAYHMGRGELAAGIQTSEDILRLAERNDDRADRMIGHVLSGCFLHWSGDLAAACEHSEQGLALYDPDLDRPHASFTQLDWRSIALGYLPLDRLILGHADEALAKHEQALNWSKALRHPSSHAYTLVQAAYFHMFCGKDAAALAVVDELVGLAREQRFAFWLAIGNITRGYLLSTRGEAKSGAALARQGFADFSGTGASLNRSYLTAVVAQSCANAGEMEEACALIASALEWAQSVGERWSEAELERLRGNLLLACRRDISEAEACFWRALAAARKQQAKWWELRAAVSLAQLRRDQGRRAEARDLLAPVYSWFTEGFATPDLKQAEALLNALG